MMPQAITAQMANLLALAEASWAPATSPRAHLLFTWVEKTIDAMPNGKQQKIVVKMAQTR